MMQKFCTEHGSIAAVLCAKFQNDRTILGKAMGERDFTRFQFRNQIRRISFIAPHPWFFGLNLPEALITPGICCESKSWYLKISYKPSLKAHSKGSLRSKSSNMAQDKQTKVVTVLCNLEIFKLLKSKAN